MAEWQHFTIIKSSQRPGAAALTHTVISGILIVWNSVSRRLFFFRIAAVFDDISSFIH